MSAKSENIAGDLVRSYNYVRRLVGIPFRDEDGLWVLSRPAFPDARFADLVELLLSEEPLRRRELGDALGVREVREVTSATLGKASYHLKKLADRERLHALMREGVAPLRSFRGRDIDGLIDQSADAVRRLTRLVEEEGFRGFSDGDDRIAGLFGREVADYVKRSLDAPRAGWAAHLHEARRAVSDFVATARSVEAHEMPRRREVRELWETLAQLPVGRRSRTRALIEAFCDWVPSGQHSYARGQSLRPAVRWDLVESAQNLADIELEALEAAERQPIPERVDRDVVTLALRLRDHRPKLPETHDWNRYRGLRVLTETVAPDMLAGVWSVLPKVQTALLGQLGHDLDVEGIPPRLMKRAIELEVVDTAHRFAEKAHFETYLDAVEKLRGRSSDLAFNVTSSWFVDLFAQGRSVPPSLVLATVRQSEGRSREVVSSLQELEAVGLAEPDDPILQAVRDWSTSRVETFPAETEAVADLLNLSERDIERYLHLRRYTGFGETFSDTILAPLELEEKEERELRALREMVAQAEGERREQLAGRIAVLEDEKGRSARLSNTVNRARNAFFRALQDLERDSVAVCRDRMTADAFQRVMGRQLDASKVERMRPIVLLATASRIDLDVLRSFLDDMVADRPLAERQTNAQWLQEMEGTIDVGRWLAGVETTIEIDGTAIEFRTETDPLQILQMGSYFDTCLSLQHGFSAAGTLINALDVNKQVVYGRRRDGTVVARKLVAATDDGRFLGYRTYAFERVGRIAERLGEALVRFARECGLEPDDEGAPTILHDGFWYDDGTEPWQPVEIRTPEDVPADEAARFEWAYVAGFEERQLWSWAANAQRNRWTDGAYGRLWIHCPERGAQIAEYPYQVLKELSRRGCVTQVGRVPGLHPWTTVAWASAHLPADPQVARAFLERVRRSRTNAEPDGGADQLVSVPGAFGMVSVAEAASFTREIVRLARGADVECLRQGHLDCVTEFVRSTADVLELAWMRDGPDDEAVDGLLADGEDLLRDVAIELLTRVRAPAAGPRLRRLLKEKGRDGRLELAVARQGTAADRWLLTQLAEQSEDEGLEDVLEALDDRSRRQPQPTFPDDQPAIWEDHSLTARDELVLLLGDQRRAWLHYTLSVIPQGMANLSRVVSAAGAVLAPDEFDALCARVLSTGNFTAEEVGECLAQSNVWDLPSYRFQEALVGATWPRMSGEEREVVREAIEGTLRESWVRRILETLD